MFYHNPPSVMFYFFFHFLLLSSSMSLQRDILKYVHTNPLMQLHRCKTICECKEGHTGRPKLIMQCARGRLLSLPSLTWLSHPRLLPAETTRWKPCEWDFMQHSNSVLGASYPLSKLIWHSQVKQVLSFVGKTLSVLFFFVEAGPDQRFGSQAVWDISLRLKPQT